MSADRSFSAVVPDTDAERHSILSPCCRTAKYMPAGNFRRRSAMRMNSHSKKSIMPPAPAAIARAAVRVLPARFARSAVAVLLLRMGAGLMSFSRKTPCVCWEKTAENRWQTSPGRCRRKVLSHTVFHHIIRCFCLNPHKPLRIMRCVAKAFSGRIIAPASESFPHGRKKSCLLVMKSCDILSRIWAWKIIN